MMGSVYRYYEWLKKGKERLPHFTKHQDGRLVLFAGLYDVAHIEGTVWRIYALVLYTDYCDTQEEKRRCTRSP